jgi:hypothetical protein
MLSQCLFLGDPLLKRVFPNQLLRSSNGIGCS